MKRWGPFSSPWTWTDVRLLGPINNGRYDTWPVLGLAFERTGLVLVSWSPELPCSSTVNYPDGDNTQKGLRTTWRGRGARCSWAFQPNLDKAPGMRMKLSWSLQTAPAANRITPSNPSYAICPKSWPKASWYNKVMVVLHHQVSG